MATDSDMQGAAKGDTGEKRTWPMWALRTDDHWPNDPGFYAYAFPDRRFPEAHADAGVKAVEVDVTLDETGDHWGWMENGAEFPEFIFHRRVAFDMCFTYGPQAEVNAGRGRIVRLSMTSASGRSDDHG